MDYVLIAPLLGVVDWIVLRKLLILGLRLIKKWTEQTMSDFQCLWIIYILYFSGWATWKTSCGEKCFLVKWKQPKKLHTAIVVDILD